MEFLIQQRSKNFKTYPRIWETYSQNFKSKSKSPLFLTRPLSSSTTSARPMAVSIIHDAPALDSFTPLEEHQEQTPATFFGGKPVLHLHTSNAQLIADESEFRANEAFSRLRNTQDEPTRAGAPVNGDAAPAAPSSRITIPNIDIWVTSE